MNRVFAFLIVGVICVAAFFVLKPRLLPTLAPHSEVVLGGKTFTIDIADTDATREQGLSNRPSLASNAGLLFSFPQPDRYGFWMKEMNFPIDIIWATAQGKIVHIESNVRPESYPTVFYPSQPASLVLEIGAGETQTLGVKIGDTMIVRRK